MGLLQKAVETYDAHASLAGAAREGHNTLPPVSHTIKSSDIEITLNKNGEFITARSLDKDEPKIVIPVTEESIGRTSAPCAHPLCDQLVYLADYNEKKHSLYLEQLEAWAGSQYTHPMLAPILAYIKSGRILNDLYSLGIIRSDADGKPEDEKLLVRWRVTGLDCDSEECWRSPSLFKAFSAWYESLQEDSPKAVCMVTGEMAVPAKQHPKGIIPSYGNAKLISANDKANFTYRGRFTDDSQAVTVSYEASQKAHNALSWLAAEQGQEVKTVFGGRTFLCWNPQGIKICAPTGLFHKASEPITNPSDYKEALRRTLNGYRSELPENDPGVVIAAFDAATTGRMSVTYYNELMASDFLQRLHDWDERCCWWFWKRSQHSLYIQSPLLFNIIRCAFGTPRSESGFTIDDRLLREQMQRLILCRVNGALMPSDIERSLVNRASSPISYDKDTRELLLSTACAVIRKYRFDHYKEDWKMSLEREKGERSYQYGRLLAILEMVEQRYYSAQGEDRETNAMKLQSAFTRRPLHTFGLIERQLENAYFPRLSPGDRGYYKKLIGEIMEYIHSLPSEDWNKPLEDTYLMGYYLQRNEFYKSKANKNTEEN